MSRTRWIRDLPEYILMLVFSVLTAVVVVWFGKVVYDREFSDSFNLAKGSWECTDSHRAQVYQPVMAGKVSVPRWIVISVCDQYTRH